MKRGAGEVLKRWRESRGLSQTAAAELVGVNQSTFSRWEAEQKNPRIEEAFRLERASNGSVPVKTWRADEPRVRKAS